MLTLFGVHPQLATHASTFSTRLVRTWLNIVAAITCNGRSLRLRSKLKRRSGVKRSRSVRALHPPRTPLVHARTPRERPKPPLERHPQKGTGKGSDVKPICSAYMLGKCTKGDNCSHHHPKALAARINSQINKGITRGVNLIQQRTATPNTVSTNAQTTSATTPNASTQANSGE